MEKAKATERTQPVRAVARQRGAPVGPALRTGAPDALAALHRALGNQAIQRLARSGQLPPELLRAAAAGQGNQAIQRLAKALQPPAAPPAEAPNLGQRIRAQAGRGSPLPTAVQRTLEGGLGADLSAVRVHTDGEADHLARAVDAAAFTSGADVFFRSGAYQPTAAQGLRVLAHEAAHTVQQASGPVAGTPEPGGVAISDPNDAFERAAEGAARQIITADARSAASARAGFGVGQDTYPDAIGIDSPAGTADSLSWPRQARRGRPSGPPPSPGAADRGAARLPVQRCDDKKEGARAPKPGDDSGPWSKSALRSSVPPASQGSAQTGPGTLKGRLVAMFFTRHPAKEASLMADVALEHARGDRSVLEKALDYLSALPPGAISQAPKISAGYLQRTLQLTLEAGLQSSLAASMAPERLFHLASCLVARQEQPGVDQLVQLVVTFQLFVQEVGGVDDAVLVEVSAIRPFEAVRRLRHTIPKAFESGCSANRIRALLAFIDTTGHLELAKQLVYHSSGDDKRLTAVLDYFSPWALTGDLGLAETVLRLEGARTESAARSMELLKSHEFDLKLLESYDFKLIKSYNFDLDLLEWARSKAEDVAKGYEKETEKSANSDAEKPMNAAKAVRASRRTQGKRDRSKRPPKKKTAVKQPGGQIEAQVQKPVSVEKPGSTKIEEAPATADFKKAMVADYGQAVAEMTAALGPDVSKWVLQQAHEKVEGQPLKEYGGASAEEKARRVPSRVIALAKAIFALLQAQGAVMDRSLAELCLTSDNPESMMEGAINLLKSTKNPDLVFLTVHYKIQATPRESEAAKAIERLVSEGKVQKPDELEQKISFLSSIETNELRSALTLLPVLSVTQLYDFKGLVKWPPTQLEWILQLGNPELWSFMANYNEEFKDFHDFWTEASILTGVVETDSILRWIKFNPAKRVAPILRVLLSFDNTASLKEIVPYAIGLNISGNVGPEYFLAAVLEKSGSLDSLVKEKVVDYKGSRQQKRHPKTGILKYTCSTNHVAYVHVHWFDSDSPKVLTSAHVKIHETDARGCELNETKNRAFFPNLLKRVCQILELTLPKE